MRARFVAATMIRIHFVLAAGAQCILLTRMPTRARMGEMRFLPLGCMLRSAVCALDVAYPASAQNTILG